jgi:DNA-directed RNA polymerase specialized sigma24 family protein
VTRAPMDRGDTLLQVFDLDPGRAAEKLRYVCARLVRYFRWRRLRDPEDLAQEALCRGFGRILDGVQVGPNPIRYFYGIARNIAHEVRKDAAKGVTIDLDAVMLSLLPIDYRNPDASILLDQYLSHVSPEEADLLIRYHMEDRAKLAADLGITDRALRVRAFRAKARLDAWVRAQPNDPGR